MITYNTNYPILTASDVPVLLLTFNRPHLTSKILSALKSIQSKKIYISSDGPRLSHPEDLQKCKEVQGIVEKIDWECEIHTNFYDENLGVKNAPVSGINWFFENVEAGIILEDDCLPNDSFFRFMAEMLDYYKDNDQIMMVSGSHHLSSETDEYSYSFGSYSSIWGWATWKRAWRLNDVQIQSWPKIRNSKEYKSLFNSASEASFFKRKLDDSYSGKIISWDYQWLFARFSNKGLSVNPSVNMVSNIGFGLDATHTFNNKNSLAFTKTEDMKFPLNHPPHIRIDCLKDTQRFRKTHRPGIIGIVKKIIERII